MRFVKKKDEVFLRLCYDLERTDVYPSAKTWICWMVQPFHLSLNTGCINDKTHVSKRTVRQHIFHNVANLGGNPLFSYDYLHITSKCSGLCQLVSHRSSNHLIKTIFAPLVFITNPKISWGSPVTLTKLPICILPPSCRGSSS